MSDAPNIRLQPRQSPEALCGFCRDSFLPEEELQTCEGCASPFHLECWRDELDEKCTTLGCVNEKPARGQRRFHALRGRLRRRRRRRLLDGDMNRGSTSGKLFAIASLLGVGLGLTWMATSLPGQDLALLIGFAVPIAAGACWFAYQRRDPT